MGKAKKTRKFAEVKRVLNTKQLKCAPMLLSQMRLSSLCTLLVLSGAENMLAQETACIFVPLQLTFALEQYSHIA